MTNASHSILFEQSRYNFYHVIHKALRLGHCRMLSALGAHDFSDADRTPVMMNELRSLMTLAKSHLEGENREIHTALEQRAPGASAHAAEDHEGHEKSFSELEALMRMVETSAGSARVMAGRALYHHYAMFAAHDIEHMNEEETELLAALHTHFTDDELHAIEGRIVAAIPPQKMAAYMTLMAPALNHSERVDFLVKLQKAMPEPVFKGLLTETIKPSLAANDYAAVVGELMLRAA